MYLCTIFLLMSLSEVFTSSSQNKSWEAGWFLFFIIIIIIIILLYNIVFSIGSFSVFQILMLLDLLLNSFSILPS